MAEENGFAEIVARCDAVTRRATPDSVSADDLTAFTADLARLPQEHPDRGRLAVTLLTTVTKGGGPARSVLVPHLDDLLRLVGRVPESMVGWPLVAAAVRAQHLAYRAAAGEQIDHVAAQRELAGYAEAVRDVPVTRMLVDAAGAAVDTAADGLEANGSKMMRTLDGVLNQLGDHPVAPAMHSYAASLHRLLDAAKKGDLHEAAGAMQELKALVETLPPEFRDRMDLSEADRGMDELFSVLDPAGSGANAGDRIRNAGPSPSAQRRARVLAAAALFQNGEQADLARIDEALDHLRDAIAMDQGDDLDLLALNGLATGLLRRTELTGSAEGLDEAEKALQGALARMRQPSHPQWTLTHELLAMVRHRLGDLPGARPFTTASQRAYVWRVLLETDPAQAKWAIRDAVSGALGAARRCLAASNVTGALRALDTGRGLLLFAEAELRALPARLTAAGHAGLADRWLDEGRHSEGLRKQVMTALLANDDIAATLLDPPSLGEIRAALATSRADALVYLVAGEQLAPGFMVIAPRVGPPAYLMLPNLQVDRGSEVELYLTALTDRARGTTRETAPVGARAGFADRVDALCDWAWQSAIGPLLESYFAGAAPGSVPSIVLLPMGDLARIPWQAARRADGTRAIELASFSQAVSARLFCENAKRDPIRPTRTGLVVGDPDTCGDAPPLTAARAEAQAVRAVFYPGARYLGRRADDSQSPSGRGTVTEVSEWLADTAPYAGTTLHLACHGRFVPADDGGTADLQLAPDDPHEKAAGKLDADEIIRILEAVPERRIGLVVMGACHTGRSIHGYDEAYSLGTAFLAAGARTVLSTHWAIPDAETSALMFLFHHYLLTEGLPAREALRAAQLWMLSPDPVPPARMPADLVSLASDRRRVVAWAGFTHAGH
ncbi:CHAT domain-containing protein [Lentzea californiensis]|uniref:CHAT domain-containing protein n=1 Tax=Lentzea californiensis TaxID=438851 RepID=UPI0021651C91|nr:CHAT domain-containing protein [Lentzea californiensis]MCR3750255.1 CHAT domain-containing protein [Lentzea californiensis]